MADLRAVSTLTLKPTGLSNIQFTTVGIKQNPTGTAEATSGYYIDPRLIDFKESERVEIMYSEPIDLFGGNVTGQRGRLVPISVRNCYIWGTSESQVITLYQDLKQAIDNPQGGMLEYKPDGITARSTFYHYLRSQPPAKEAGNVGQWEIQEAEAGDIYILDISFELTIYPVATSDPENLVTLSPSQPRVFNSNFGRWTTQAPNVLVGIDHETGVPSSEYDGSTGTGSTTLLANTATPLSGIYDLKLDMPAISSNAIQAYKQFTSSSSVLRLHALIDVDSLTISPGDTIYPLVLSNNSSVGTVTLRLVIYKTQAGIFYITAQILDDAGLPQSTTTYTLSGSDGALRVEALFTRASSAVASDGTLAFFVNGTQVGATVTGIDLYDRAAPSYLHVGNTLTNTASTFGQIYFDNIFLCAGTTEIGPTFEKRIDFDIASTSIKGDLPAICWLTVRNGQTTTSISRLFVGSRSSLYSTLANFVQIYEAQAATILSPTTNWSTQTDSGRSGGQFMRCAPGSGANGQANGLRVAIANEADHRGRCLVFAVCKTNTFANFNWRCFTEYSISGEIVARSDEAQVEQFGTWHLSYCGQIDLPPAPLSTGGGVLSPSLDIYFKRIAGSDGDSIDIDFFILFFENETLAQFDNDQTFDNATRLLYYMLPNGIPIAQLIDNTGQFKNSLKRVFGSPALLLHPAVTTRVAIQTEMIDISIDEDFSTYEAFYWRLLNDFDTSTNWTGSNATLSGLTIDRKEGFQALQILLTSAGVEGYAEYDFGSIQDLLNDGRFEANDYVSIFATADGVTTSFKVIFLSSDKSETATKEWTSTVGTGDSFLSAKRSDFSVSGGWSWADVRYVRIAATATPATSVRVDYLRIEKADPNASAFPNPTGSNWDFEPQGSQWAITKDSLLDTNPLLANLTTADSAIKIALRNTTVFTNSSGYAKIMARGTGANTAGMIFRVSDTTPGSEDWSDIQLDWGNDEIIYGDLVAGSYTSTSYYLGSGALSEDRYYWIGYIVHGDERQIFFSATEPDGNTRRERLNNLLTATNKIATISTTANSSGTQAGVRSLNTSLRVDEFYVESFDGHNPEDYVDIETSALFRTISPFGD